MPNITNILEFVNNQMIRKKEYTIIIPVAKFKIKARSKTEARQMLINKFRFNNAFFELTTSNWQILKKKTKMN